jgi:divalent metal cation (Fe/Co/Zn/Cd) transporter
LHADADLDIDAATTLAEAHQLAHQAEHRLAAAIPKLGNAVVHAYPAHPLPAVATLVDQRP